jgi:cobalt transporter subunit CbtA
MIGRIFYPGLIAGVIAGLFLFAAQQIQLVPLIVEAEAYESAAPAHVHGDAAGAAHPGAAHEVREWAPGDGIERALFTGLASLLSAIGFALVLAGCFAFRRRRISWREGVVWGLAGYVAFQLAPAFGLSPELPTMAGDNMLDRQIWWIGTVAATAAGLAAVAFARAPWLKVAGLVLIAAPHLVGAPHAHVETEVPAALAAQFAVASLVIGALFWGLLGGLTGYFYRRLAPAV